MQLRPYQEFAVSSAIDYFAEHDGAPLVVLPTGAGKSVVLAYLLKEVLDLCPSEHILVVSHVREILTQNAAKIQAVIPGLPIGIYSAGLGKKSIRKITVAGIQSIYRQRSLPPFGLVIIDEAHLTPRTGNGMYLTLLNRLRDQVPDLRLVGLTATPFRLDSGLLHEGPDRIFTDVCCNVGVRELIDDGFLSPLVTKHANTQADLSGVRTRAGDFIAEQVEAAMDRDELIRGAVDEMLRFGEGRRSWLAFCSGIKHAGHVREELERRGVSARSIFGETENGERERLIKQFKAGEFRCLVSVQTLTTGFDAPCVDLIAMLRPTKSIGLWHQIVGRGLRLSPETGKTNCMVLDFANCARTLGPIDAPIVHERSGRGNSEPSDDPKTPVSRVCPECLSISFAFIPECPDCGYQWPPPEPKHDATASTAEVISSGEKPREETRIIAVTSVSYRLHRKPEKTDSMRVDYNCGMDTYSEWICLDHQGFARQKAEGWWKRRAWPGHEVPPRSVEEGLERAEMDLRAPEVIFVKREGKYDRILGARFDPQAVRPEKCKWLEEDIPF